MNDVLTVKEFAEAIDCPYQTVIRWVRSGKVPSEKVGDIYLVRKSAVADFKKIARQRRRGRPRKGKS